MFDLFFRMLQSHEPPMVSAKTLTSSTHFLQPQSAPLFLLEFSTCAIINRLCNYLIISIAVLVFKGQPLQHHHPPLRCLLSTRHPADLCGAEPESESDSHRNLNALESTFLTFCTTDGDGFTRRLLSLGLNSRFECPKS